MDAGDRKLILSTVEAIEEAKRSGNKKITIDRPAGLVCSDAEFEQAVVAELGRRGQIERKYQQ